MASIALVVDAYDGYRVIRFTADTIWQEHSYLLAEETSREAILIDPGHGIADFLNFVVEQNWNVKWVLATHAHFDHVAGAAEVVQRLSKACIIHAKERRLFLHAPMYSIRFGGVSMKRPKEYILMDETLQKRLETFGLSVLWTPGHTQGGMTFFYRNVAFTGDTLLNGYVGRTDLPDSNEGEIMHSVSSIVKELEQRNIQRIYPGHGDSWDVDAVCQWWEVRSNSVPHLDRFIR